MRLEKIKDKRFLKSLGFLQELNDLTIEYGN